MATLSYWIVMTVPTAWVLPSRPCRHVGVSTQLMGSTSTKHRLTPLSGDRGFHPTHSIFTRPNEPHGCWHTPRGIWRFESRPRWNETPRGGARSGPIRVRSGAMAMRHRASCGWGVAIPWVLSACLSFPDESQENATLYAVACA